MLLHFVYHSDADSFHKKNPPASVFIEVQRLADIQKDLLSTEDQIRKGKE